MILVFSYINNFLCGRRLAAIMVLLSSFLIFSTDQTRAHAKMIRSQPASGETLQQAPKAVELEFNQKLQTGDVNSIFVTDENGGRVDKNSIVVSEDGKKLQVELEDLSSGAYRVEWKALSADEHSIKGSFAFRVAVSKGEIKTVAAPQDDFQDFAAPPTQESGTNWIQMAARWIAHLAMTMLFGGFAFLLLVLKPSLQSSPIVHDEEQAASFKHGKNLFIRLAWLNLVLLVVSAVAALVLQTSDVYSLSLANAIAPANLLRTSTETSFGETWLLQAVFAVLLFFIVFSINRQSRKNASLTAEANGKTLLLWLGLCICALLFLAQSLSGHAWAAAREYPFAIVSQWLHLIAVGVWLGGLFHLVLILPRSIENFDGVQRLSVLANSIGRFSRYAVAFSILLAITGIYSSWIHVKEFSDLWTSVYGNVLTAKIAVFLLMLALGGFNSFFLSPRIQRLIEAPDSESRISRTSRFFYRAVGIEAALGAIALLLAAVLAFAPLGHQH
ncbi:MAG: copper resistance protein CopC [Acidobacteriota bacterium]|nr:copper resistance protein CopC [Acidobacteriota bacterium]